MPHSQVRDIVKTNALKLAAIGMLAALQSAIAGVGPSILLTETFDPDGEGSTYTSSTFDDGGQDYFERQTANPDPRHQAGLGFTFPQGGSYWTSEDVGSPASPDASNPLGSHGIVRLNNLAVNGFNNLQVRVFLATADTLRFDIEDIIEVQFALDGDLPGDPANLTQGTYTTIGRFIGNGPDIFASEAMKLDSDLDGVVFGDGDDTFSPTLSSTMQEFAFDVPFSGDDLSVQIRIEQNGGTEEIAFDHIRVQGTVAVTDPPVLANIEGSSIMFTEADPATQVTNAITVTDPDSPSLQSASVVITAGLDPTEDVLTASPPAGITASPYNPITGTLTFFGSASLADYQTALRSVSYQNIDSVNPSTAIRSIRFQVSDGSSSSNFQTRNVQITSTIGTGTIPHTEDLNSDGEGARYTSSTYNQGGMDFFERSSNPHPGHDAGFVASPPQSGDLWAFEDVGSAGNPLGDHGILRLQNLDASGLSNLEVSLFLGELAALGEAGDKIEIQYAFDGDIPANPTDLSSGNYTTFGRFVADSPDLFTTGPMRLDSDLDGTTHLDPEDAASPVLSSFMTEHSFTIPATGTALSIQVRVEQNGGSEEFAFDHIRVTGSAVAGSPPTLAAIEAGAIPYTEGDPATPVSGTITVADPDPTLIASATVQITAGFAPSQDLLADNGSVPASIAVDPFNTGTGTLTLNGPASPAEFQAALRAITYQNTNPVNPSTALRTITFQAIDGDSNPSNLQSRDILVTPVISSAAAPLLEEFETDGNGERYTASAFNTGALHSFFERVTANPDPRHGAGPFTGFAFTPPQGGAYWAAEDVANPANPLVNHGIIRMRDVEMTGWTDREVRLYLAQSDNRFDLNDKIEIQYAIDGNSGGSNLASGNYTTIGRFIGAGADVFSDGAMKQDANLNGFGGDDTGSPTLNTTMTEHVFAIPDGGELVSVQIRVEQNGGSEELAIDHITITGTAPVETVTSAGDNGPGSLRQTIADGVPGTTILFDPSLDGDTITLTTGQLLLDKDLTIDATSLDRGLTISGGGTSRVFQVTTGTSVLLRKLTIADGSAGNGGGIFSNGTLEVRDCTFVGNHAGGGGAISSAGVNASLTVINSTITGNSAIFGGAILSRDGAFALIHSTVSGNIGTGGTGAFVLERGTATIENSIVAGNRGTASHDFGGATTIVTAVGANVVGSNNGNYAAVFPADGILIGTEAAPVDPLLAPFGRYGGCTRTMHPLAGSPVLDAAITSGTTPATDQRGLPRNVGGAPDLGAVEGGPVITVINTNNSGAGSLRQAILDSNANPGTRIYFDPAVFPATVQITSQITVGGGRNIFIDASDIPGGVTVDGAGATRLFIISGSSIVGMDSFTFTGGNGSGGDGGACIVDNSSLHLNRSTVTNNIAPGGLGGGILMFGVAETHLSNSLVSNNTAPSFGGGLMSFSGDFILTNTTSTENQSGPGSAVYMQGTGHLSLNHATVSANIGGNALQNGATSTTLENSVVAGNTGGDLLNPGGSTYLGNNLIGGNPLLAPLSDYGGPTLTMPPLLDSPALDAAVSLASTPSTDQRSFVRNQGVASDLGAVERSALFAEAGPQLIANTTQFLTNSVRRDDTAGDTLFFRYTVDPISDFSTEDYFAGFQLYDNGAERLGVGNPYFRAAYGAYLTTVGDIDLNSAAPEPGFPYELVQSGVVRTLVFRVDFVPGGVDNVSVWLAPDLSLPDFAQPPTLLTTFTANCTFNEVRLREGFSANGWTYSDMEISELSPFATPVTFASLHPGLDPNADENGDGLSNYYHYAAGDDPANPVSLPTLIGGLYTHTARVNGSDVILDYEYSFGLSSFLPMVEGVHYTIDSTSFTSPDVQSITIDVLFDPMVDPDVYWRHRFVSEVP